MPNTKTSLEDAAGPITGAEILRVLQGGVNKRTTVSQVAAIFGGSNIVPSVWSKGDATSSITTSSNAFGDVPTFPALNIAGIVGDVLEFEFNCGPYFSSGSPGETIFFAFDVNGTLVPAAAYSAPGNGFATTGSVRGRHVVLSGDIVSGSVAIKPQWKVSAGAGTCNIENDAQIIPLFTVKNFGPDSGASSTNSSWSKTDKDPSIKLSNRFVLTQSANGVYKLARGSKGVDAATSIAYFEISTAASNNSNYYLMIGVADASTPVTDFLGQNTGSYGYQGSSALVFNNNATLRTYDNYAAGDCVGVLIKNGALYYRLNGVWQGGSDPSTDTSPAATGLTGMFYPAVCLFNLKDSVIGAFKSNFQTYNDWPAWG